MYLKNFTTILLVSMSIFSNYINSATVPEFDLADHQLYEAKPLATTKNISIRGFLDQAQSTTPSFDKASGVNTWATQLREGP